ncbi:MAG TPA: TetR/AcrR family transcriptional regulator [Verrucomicrobiae bacterium]|jgi:AcrR family transcriptional regulator|nr:TetR/AcrR family transcriptional regulator [Verrucomicrobiae bacterium]
MSLVGVTARSSPASLGGRRPRHVTSGRDLTDDRGTPRDRRLAKVLEHATRIFWEKGYEGASMRDLSRATGMSLAGLYYYFASKEELLYLIQKHTFTTIMEQLRERLAGVEGPEERVRVFIRNHVAYFLANQEAMKVLTHEDETLKNVRGAQIRAIKRQYYRICLDLMEDLQRATGLQFSGRLAVLSLFGMINWIYTWHNPRVDGDAETLARQMGDIFLRGVLRGVKAKTAKAKS